jgi:ABC-2 type transport system permease protein
VIRRIIRAYPTLLRVGLAEAVAYRAELLVWMLTTTMPLVMLALWTAVAREAPFGRFGQTDFVAYYLGALIVRTIASCWVVWELNQEIRAGTLSMRLLRPIHPFVAYSAEHLAAIPLRALVALPIAVVLLVTTGGSRIASDPFVAALIVPTLAGAWLILFFSQTILGSLAMMIERSQSVWEIWMGLYAVLSGYLVPLELMPRWLAVAADWLPFRYMLGLPVEVMTGMADRGAALRGLAVQWAMIGVLFVASQIVWKKGLRRFEAYGA